MGFENIINTRLIQIVYSNKYFFLHFVFFLYLCFILLNICIPILFFNLHLKRDISWQDVNRIIRKLLNSKQNLTKKPRVPLQKTNERIGNVSVVFICKHPCYSTSDYKVAIAPNHKLNPASYTPNCLKINSNYSVTTTLKHFITALY